MQKEKNMNKNLAAIYQSVVKEKAARLEKSS
jgi:hypothetical protein